MSRHASRRAVEPVNQRSPFSATPSSPLDGAVRAALSLPHLGREPEPRPGQAGADLLPDVTLTLHAERRLLVEDTAHHDDQHGPKAVRGGVLVPDDPVDELGDELVARRHHGDGSGGQRLTDPHRRHGHTQAHDARRHEQGDRLSAPLVLRVMHLEHLLGE